ncbi:MAG: methionyl-tRNA formyltransferase [Arcticibacterium sp.]|jgi:methionyl-tRNA formyltransferase
MRNLLTEMKIGLMVSGGLGFDMLLDIFKGNHISAILTDHNSDAITNFAKGEKIPAFIGNPRKGRAREFIEKHPIDLLLSINYLFIIESDLINWASKASVNFHGSLLPKYRGRTPHVWAIINNESETGVTAHFITAGCDEGDIIDQVIIPIDTNDTGADILNKYREAYPQLLDKVLEEFKKAEVLGLKQDESKATYFGKRTPDDGLINWDWQKERIYNWVRAQAHPYPGAFSFLRGEKIIIDQVAYDDFGYHQDQSNGLILTRNPVRVKTPNGVLQLLSVRQGLEIIEIHDILEANEN